LLAAPTDWLHHFEAGIDFVLTSPNWGRQALIGPYLPADALENNEVNYSGASGLTALLARLCGIPVLYSVMELGRRAGLAGWMSSIEPGWDRLTILSARH